jgi:hypothetical protein
VHIPVLRPHLIANLPAKHKDGAVSVRRTGASRDAAQRRTPPHWESGGGALWHPATAMRRSAKGAGALLVVPGDGMRMVMPSGVKRRCPRSMIACSERRSRRGCRCMWVTEVRRPAVAEDRAVASSASAWP